MNINTSFIFSPWANPYRNLAFEDQLLRSIKPDEKALLVYKNDPCVVLGRFQNPWREVNVNGLGDTLLVRRQSGGGTVYHDEGNLCFSFIHGTRDHHKDSNNEIIINALKEFDIKAYASDRSDLKIDGLKFSGSAFKQKKDSSFHHGTLLFASKLDRLNSILNSPLKNLEGKGILSNPSKVVNLTELNSRLTIDSFVPVLKSHFEQYYNSRASSINADFQNVEYQVFLESWKWRLGETPLFKFSVNGVDFEIKNAIITACSRAHLIGLELQKELHSKLDEDLRDQLKDFFI